MKVKGKVVSEAIRKLFRSTATRLSSILAVMKHRTITMSGLVQHKMDVTDLEHSRPGYSTTLIVLTLLSTSTMPGVRPLHHPEFRQRRTTIALVGFQGRGFAEVVQPDFCHSLFLKPCFFNGFKDEWRFSGKVGA
jgi:hypothetical protein